MQLGSVCGGGGAGGAPSSRCALARSAGPIPAPRISTTGPPQAWAPRLPWLPKGQQGCKRPHQHGRAITSSGCPQGCGTPTTGAAGASPGTHPGHVTGGITDAPTAPIPPAGEAWCQPHSAAKQGTLHAGRTHSSRRKTLCTPACPQQACSRCQPDQRRLGQRSCSTGCGNGATTPASHPPGALPLVCHVPTTQAGQRGHGTGACSPGCPR